MKIIKLPILLLLSVLLFLQSCQKNDEFEMEGYVPIYENDIESRLSFKDAPQNLKTPGKIYIYENYLFVVERTEGKEGIHVIDNTDKSNPTKKAFYNIPGCSEISIQNQILYTNFGSGLLTVDIGSVTNAKFLNFIAFPNQGAVHPDRSTSKKDLKGRINFICPEEDKGIVVGWQLGKISGKYCSIN